MPPIGRILGETSGPRNPDSALCESYPPGAQYKVEEDEEYRGRGRWKRVVQQVAIPYSKV